MALATNHGARRAVIAIPIFLIVAGVCLKILVDTDVLLGPPAQDFRTTIIVPLYKNGRTSWSVTDSWHFGRALPPDGRGGPTEKREDNPSTRLEYGYALVHEAGPEGFRSWLGEESLWIRASPLPDGDVPNSATLGKLLEDAAPAILGDPTLLARSIEIGVVHPNRKFLNWRGFAGWWATAIVGVAFLQLLAVGVFLRRIGQRPRLINAGLCPVCRYSIRGAKSDRCSECGEPLSTYEQTIVSAQRP